MEKKFVLHEHHSSHHHFDFRLEIGGVLVSWAVPKGVSEEPGEKRLAIRTPDHNFEYADFEGEIPEGEYGAGQVKIYDNGHYSNERSISVEESLEAGKIVITLHGKKLNGSYTLLRTKMEGEGEQWLIFKKKSS